VAWKIADKIAHKIAHMSYETFLTITLTALCAILAAMTIIIGVAAICGYYGIKNSVIEAAEKKAEKIASDKISEYPSPTEMREVIDSLKVYAANLLNATPAGSNQPETLSSASDKGKTVGSEYPGQEEIHGA
jgi:hypothetical protein